MTSLLKPPITHLVMLIITVSTLWARPSWGQMAAETSAGLPEDYSCIVCHRKGGELWTEATPVVDEKALAGGIHWQKGLRCTDCHGGSPLFEPWQDCLLRPARRLKMEGKREALTGRADKRSLAPSSGTASRGNVRSGKGRDRTADTRIFRQVSAGCPTRVFFGVYRCFRRFYAVILLLQGIAQNCSNHGTSESHLLASG